MTKPAITDAELADMEAHHSGATNYSAAHRITSVNVCVSSVPRLIAEVRRLREALKAKTPLELLGATKVMAAEDRMAKIEHRVASLLRCPGCQDYEVGSGAPCAPWCDK